MISSTSTKSSLRLSGNSHPYISEWLILIFAVVFIILFIYSIVRLSKTWGKWTFDVFVIFLSLVEIILIVLQEFVVHNVKLELFVIATQTGVLLGIVFNFIRYFFLMLGRGALVARLLFPLTFIVGVVLLGTLIDGLSVSSIFSCHTENFTYQWYLISALNLILAIIMIIFSSEMKRQLKQSAEKIHIDQHDTKMLRMRLRQLSTLQLWILLLSIVRLAWFILAHLTLVKDQIACYENNYFESVTQGGSVFLLIKSIIIDLGPQFLFWIIFFQIPHSFKFLVTTQQSTISQFDLRNNSRQYTLAQKKELINSLIENDNREYERISKLASNNRLPLVQNESPERQEVTNLRHNGSFVESQGESKDQNYSSGINGINTTEEASSTDNRTIIAFQFSETLFKEPQNLDQSFVEGGISREESPNQKNLMSSLVRPQSPNSWSKHRIGKKKGGGASKPRERKGSLYDSQ